MDSGSHPNNCESFILFNLEKSHYSDCGSDGVYRPKVRPELLNLFPLTPAVQSSEKEDSMQSLGYQGQQMSEEDSGTDVVNRSKSELRSRDHDGSALFFSTYRTSEYVPEETTLQNPFEKPRKELSWAVVDSVCHQSSCKPSVNPSDISPKEGQCLQAVRELIGSEPTSTCLNNGASTSAKGKSNASASASSSKASVENVSPLTPSVTPLEHTMAVQLGAQAAGPRRPSVRHGPRPKSSPFRGVTHYKRTGRWEAHIWSRGKQIYLGASSTAEKAARAYDRAAIHFRRMGAELNFYLEDYAGEMQRLVEIAESELVAMLRKQSAGEGSLHPEYPRLTALQHSPRAIGPPINLAVREEISHEEHPVGSPVESVPQRTHVNSTYVKYIGSCSSSIRTMAQSDQPEGESTLHVPQAAHVSERRGQYLQVIDNLTADFQSPHDRLKLS